MKKIKLVVVTLLVSFHMVSAQESSHKSIEEIKNQSTNIQDHKAVQRIPQKRSWWTKTKIIGASIVGTTAILLGSYATYLLLISNKRLAPLEMFPLPEEEIEAPSAPLTVAPAAPPSAPIVEPTTPATATIKQEDPALIARLQERYNQIQAIYEQARNRETSPIIRLHWEKMRGELITNTINPNIQQKFPQVWNLVKTKSMTINKNNPTYDSYINEVNTIIATQNDLTLKRAYYRAWIRFYDGMFSKGKMQLTQDEKQTLRRLQS